MIKEKTISITIDNMKIEARPSQTILQAAREHHIYIPSLCALEHLPSYGACRLCVVEVDGIRGFPTSCTTPVEEGMVIRTDTAEIRSLRQEVLKLLLSEHPASCLFCSEQDECGQFMGTIRKVGVTTGCRYCPNDHRCELQQIAENIGLTETTYPVYYRNFPLEKHDPFYDRDYNLCILCGRCVRVCNDIRLNGTLSFKQRGRYATIGPAFDRSHLEVGCEFCGACVTACPTGALAAKVSKWYGTPDDETETTCNYCSMGCSLTLQIKTGEVIDALPDYDSPVEEGLICVKGRFCIPEYIHSPLRYGTPQELTSVGYNNITWDEAITKAVERLTDIKPDECLIVVSPQLLNEDLFAVQQFARDVIRTDGPFSSFFVDLEGDAGLFLDLALSSGHFSAIEEAKDILVVGFDSTFGYSYMGINAKKAVRSGASMVNINAHESNLDLLADAAFVVDSARWADILDLFAVMATKEKEGGKTMKSKSKTTSPDRRFSDLLNTWGADMERVSQSFAHSKDRVIIVGPEVIASPDRKRILESIINLRDKGEWKVVVAHEYTNLPGMVALGALFGIKPGAATKKRKDSRAVTINGESLNKMLSKRKKVIYLIGEGPIDGLPQCDYLIYQNAIPAEFERQPDLILPVSLFPESEGTIINSEGRILPVRRAIEPYMESRPDWWIVSAIAEKLKKGKMKFHDIPSIQEGINKIIRGFPNVKKRLEFREIDIKGKISPTSKKAAGIIKNKYRGIPIAKVVSGMKSIESHNGYGVREEGPAGVPVAQGRRQ